MSIGQPKEAILYPNGTAEYPVRYNNNLSPSRRNVPGRSKWNLGSLQLPDGSRVRTRLSRKVRKKLEKFLWLYTQCPVIYRWKDLGSRYWPRWIKQGRCHANQSCSFPPGRTCRASEEREVVILRWHCQYWDPPRFCKWIPLHYPIVRQCTCGCSATKSINWISSTILTLSPISLSDSPRKPIFFKRKIFWNSLKEKRRKSKRNFLSNNQMPAIILIAHAHNPPK